MRQHHWGRLVFMVTLIPCCGIQAATYGPLPLAFEEDRGQAGAEVNYLARGQGYGLFLSPGSATLRLAARHSTAELRMNFVGAGVPAMQGLDLLPGSSRYYRGNSPGRWIAEAPSFARVSYRDVYPGIDLVFYGKDQYLEYDFLVAPKANPRAIRLAFTGADRLRLDRGGDLVLHIGGGEVRMLKPVAYQDVAGERRRINVNYSVRGKQVGFLVGAYDAAHPLVIDPVLTYSSYLGGGGMDGATAVAVDAAGNGYFAGWTSSANFPTSGGAPQPAAGGLTDAFVVKIDSTGKSRLYSTYLGGSGDDYGKGIALDSNGNIYVVGSTQSSDFPTRVPLQGFGGATDAFVAKLSPAGALLYSTYLGGSGNDDARAVALDTASNIYVAGVTDSVYFPMTAGGFHTSLGGASDAFVVKLNASGTAKLYATYLGGSNSDEATGIAVDGFGDAWVTGSTWSSDFPVRNGRQAYGGSLDAFVAKLNPAGTDVLFATFLGGSSVDRAAAIAVDANGNAYVTGDTGSGNFPTTTGAFQTASSGLFPDEDAFVVKYTANGSQVAYATRLGGTGDDAGFGIAVDATGNAVVTGQTTSANFPVLSNVRDFSGAVDGFITVLNALGSALTFSTWLGGSNNDTGRGITADANGRAYIAGMTNSTNFPVRPSTGALQSAPGGGFQEGFVAAVQYCDYLASVTGGPFTAVGGNGSLLVTANSGCPWSASTDAPWIIFTSGSTGSGNGTVSFAVAANPSVDPRTGTLTAGWQSADVTQSNAPQTPQTITFGPLANRVFGTAPFAVSATASSGLTVSFASLTPAVCTVAGATVTLVSAGTCTVQATQAGNSNYAPATPVSRSFTVTRAPQTITFGTLANKVFGTAPFPVSATASFGLAVSFNSQTTGVCTVSGATVTLVSVGTCTVQATQAGNSNYAAATPVSRSFTVTQGSQTITFGTLANKVFGTAPLAVSATASSGLAVGFISLTPAVCTVSGTTVTLVSAGTCTIQATQTGNTNYAAATPVNQSFTVTRAPQTITFGALPNRVFGTAPFAVSATASSGLAVSFASLTPAVCTVAGATVTLISAGTCTIQATQSGNTNYGPATPVNQSFTVTRAGQIITFPAIPNQQLGTAPFAVSATASSGLAVSFISLTPAVCTVSGATVTLVSAGTCTIQATQAGSSNYAAATPVSQSFQVAPQALRFVSVTPCRIADTRNPTGPFGGPKLGTDTSRDFNIPASACGIPANAAAYSLNLTVVPVGGLGFLSVWPAGLPQPVVSTLNSDGRVKANAAIVPGGLNDAISVYASDATQLVIDINGYFVPSTVAQSLAFYPVTPCRIADTRLATGTFGGPALVRNVARDFPVQSSHCGIPATAQAYALNMTVVPPGGVGFLTAWPAGLPLPEASTLNASSAAVTANAAIVPAGAGGAISVYASDSTHVIIDINGYFAPPGAAGSLDFFTATPCRILDTRLAGPFGGPIMGLNQSRSFIVPSSSCGIPATAKAYSLNATVVPVGGLGFLTLWGSGSIPVVSTLNSGGSVTSNAALVPAGISGAVTAFTSDATHLILDINGYFQ